MNSVDRLRLTRPSPESGTLFIHRSIELQTEQGVFPVSLHMRQERSHSRTTFVSIVSVLALVLTACSRNEVDNNSQSTRGESSRPPLIANPHGYTGVAPCAECHAERVREYQTTNHFKSMRVPEPAEFQDILQPGANRLTTRVPEVSFEFAAPNRELTLTALLGRPATQRRISRKVDWVIGSGKLFEGFLSRDNDALHLLPVGHYVKGSTLSNCPGYTDGEARFDRPIKPRCLDCHTTWFTHHKGSENQYQFGQEILGVSCERCHGPGRSHVERHRAEDSLKEPAEIVRPALLSRELRLDICGQCHGNPGTLIQSAFTYLPGTPLSEYIRGDDSDSDTFVHTANQVQRLRSSRCFTERDQLECLSCHDPHKKDNRDIFRKSNRECVSCHKPELCNGRREVPIAAQSECVACHMPRRVDVATTFATATDDHVDLVHMTEHGIGIFPLESQLFALDLSVKSDDPLTRSRHDSLKTSVVQKFREQAAESRRQRRFVEAISVLRRAARLVPEDDNLSRELAEIKALQVNVDRARQQVSEALRSLAQDDGATALRSFREAIACDPENADAHFNLGVLAHKSGEFSVALGHLEIARQQQPNRADLLNTLGLVVQALGRPEEALGHFRRAVELQPAHSETNFNLAQLLLQKRQWTEARKRLEDHLVRQPRDIDSRVQAAEAAAAEGQLNIAATHLMKALEFQPDHLAGLCLFGEVLAAERKFDVARQQINRALELAPESPRPHRSAAICLAREGRINDALISAGEAIIRDPENIEIYILVADFNLSAGRTKDALDALKEADRLATAAGQQDLIPIIRAQMERLQINR